MASLLPNGLVVLFIISFCFAVIFGSCHRFSSPCSSGQVCCSHRCLNESSCLYQSCSMDSDCSVNEACCSGMCQSGYDCSGYPCSSSNNCSYWQYCLYGVCENTDMYSYNYAVIILFTVVSSLVAFFIVLMFIYYCYRRVRLGRPGRVETERRVTTTVATTTQSASHALPQAHQQGYPYQSLPQDQNAAPPPYSGGMATGSDLPPPYNSRTQGKPEEGHTSRRTYGAVQST